MWLRGFVSVPVVVTGGAESDWRPKFQYLRAGPADTINWYRSNEGWRSGDEADAEARLGR